MTTVGPIGVAVKRRTSRRRRGSVLPFICVLLLPMLAFVALAVDLGLVAVARTQCQNAADAGALAAVRTLSAAGNNLAQATANAQGAASANKVLGSSVPTANVTVSNGAYHYNPATQTFTPQFPAVAPDNYSASQVTVTSSSGSAFSKISGVSALSMSATAVAAFRPRDVAVVLDFSGSMNNETDIWNCESYLGNMINTPNNTDATFPQYGWYAPSFSAQATLQCTSSDSRVGYCNITQPVGGIPALAGDFYSNARGAAGASAFAPAPATVTNTSPAGDPWLDVKGSTTPALTWADVTGGTNRKFRGYKNYTGKTFLCYTQAPGYWGKTFFAWPPDTAVTAGVPNDWRKRFFFLADGSTPCNNNTALWDGGGNWKDPPGNYVINYKAILNWIVNTGPSVFPAQLRAGNILYYDQIPTDVPASAYNHSNPNSSIADPNQRFWKEYIDFTIGVWRDPFANIQRPGTSSCSYGPDFAAGPNGTSAVQITGPDSRVGNVVFIGANDNPLRPRHRFWFGPMTMIQYLLDTGLVPGTVHDISMVVAKLGIAGALQDIQNNHPNDNVALMYYARPTFSGEPTGAGVFDSPQASLGQNYSSMINALWFPPNSGSSDVRPWDANGDLAPRAHGDYCSNTATSYGLMLAYNQFSGNNSLVSKGMGGFGRKGAQKLVVLETDGMANVSTTCGTSAGGAYNSFYNIGASYSYSNGSTDPATDAINAANQICALDSATGPANLPGYSTASKPVIVQCIAFGAIFEPTASGSTQSSAVSLLQSISTIGGTVFPSSASDPANGYKWCIGTLSQRQNKLQQAFTKISDSTISIVLVK
ncbi:MAG TPA: pilus assembly protein TadG-related protein [Pirellulales bacterium]|nr:pilus assembly protein TadG-related protein [Pirellulales bacterium]